jgi:hypothetical protein
LKGRSAFAGQAKWSAGCRRARQTRGARDAGQKKKPAGWTTRQAFWPEGWTSRRTNVLAPGGSTRTTPRMRHAAPRRRRVQRNADLVRGSCPNLQQGRQKAKDPVACGLPGLVDLRRPSLRTWGSRKAVQRHRHATHPPLLRGSSTCLARSGTASSNFSCDQSHVIGRVVSHWHCAVANLGRRETNTAPANRQQKRCARTARGSSHPLTCSPKPSSAPSA